MNKVLIVYATKYGCARHCANEIKNQMGGDVTLLDISTTKKRPSVDSKAVDLSPYNLIIIGGSFYVGRWQKSISEFCEYHLETLKQKKHAFFACHLHKGVELEQEITLNIPESLYKTAVAVGRFGGICDFKQMNFMERFIIKQVAKSKKEPIVENNLDSAAIAQFVKELQM